MLYYLSDTEITFGNGAKRENENNYILPQKFYESNQAKNLI